MFYVVVVLVVAVVTCSWSCSRRRRFSSPSQISFPFSAAGTLDTSLSLLIAASALGGAFLTWLSGLSQARRMSTRMKKLEGMVRKAKEAIADRDETIAQYEEQLIELGVIEPPEEDAPEADAAAAEPQAEGSDVADVEGDAVEEGKG